MPGLHVLAILEPSEIQTIRVKFLTTLEKMKHYNKYEASVALDDKEILVGYSGYKYYPFKHIKTENTDILIEGNIYNLSDTEIKAALARMSLDETKLKENTYQFISKAQGEFLIALYNRGEKTLLIFNDILGRLPAYYYVTPQIFLVSKEVKFILPYLPEPTFNKEALAEYLIFRFPLESRTLVKNITRLPPATMISVDLKKKTHKIKPIMSWNLDSEPYVPSDIENVTSNLVSTFLHPTEEMAKFSKNKTIVVSLSGGYDSRTVLAGLSKVGVKPVAFTFVNDKAKDELPAAKEIARILNIKHEIIPVSNATDYSIKQMQWLAYLKDGLNSVNHFQALEFAQLISKYFKGEIIDFSGDGGDKTLAPLGFNFSINSSKQLAETIYLSDKCYSLEQVSLMLDMDKKRLLESFQSILDSYPETTLEGKFKHFKIFERGFKWLFEGESRNRFIHWQTSPFYSPDFFTETMKLPESVKKGRYFYKKFLSLINKECAEVRYGKSKVEKLLYRVNRVFPKRKPENIDYIKSISTQILDRNKTARDYFNLTNTKKILAKVISEEKTFILLTILMYMDILDGNMPSILKA